MSKARAVGICVAVILGVPAISQATPAKVLGRGQTVHFRCPPGKKPYFRADYNGAHIAGGKAWCYTPKSDATPDTDQARGEAQSEEFTDAYATNYTFAGSEGGVLYKEKNLLLIIMSY
jgi:hypothetical protein